MKKALVSGVSGQDGSYLAELLLKKGYEVYGGSRDAQAASFSNLEILKIKKDIQLISVNITDFRNTLDTILKIKPDEIYNLSGQSSVGLSFEQPVETLESISIGNLNLLEAVRFTALPIKLYNAGSSECFGDTSGEPADETTAFRPRSPYAVAKATAYWQLANYREAYALHACTGILFNHESPLRKENFVTRKIISTACRIYKGSTEKLYLGNIDISRDWGWAPEYVEAMWLMMQREVPEDFVIATGKTHTLAAFIDLCFSKLGLLWTDHVRTDPKLFRLTDLHGGKANPSKAEKVLGWKAQVSLESIIERMIEAELIAE
ncbi:MAG: GDP-mannose 4,6-dehydratase [Sediminibacterium sp.]|nr:GDP-mannose 4,6-dehydratase [Sediminibacterium sp.]